MEPPEGVEPPTYALTRTNPGMLISPCLRRKSRIRWSPYVWQRWARWAVLGSDVTRCLPAEINFVRHAKVESRTWLFRQAGRTGRRPGVGAGHANALIASHSTLLRPNEDVHARSPIVRTSWLCRPDVWIVCPARDSSSASRHRSPPGPARRPRRRTTASRHRHGTPGGARQVQRLGRGQRYGDLRQRTRRTLPGCPRARW